MTTIFCYQVYDIITGRIVRMGLTREQAIAESIRSNLGWQLM
jgi:hypothetical protein